MRTTMKILGWAATGLRCPDHVIDCRGRDGTPWPVTLIQMPNGTGKTTTLNLLRAAMSGAAQSLSWSAEQVRELRKKDGPDYGTFELRLLLNDRRVTITLSFDFSGGRVSYKTTRGQGQVHGFDPPAEFRRFMNETFVNFFIFDGELAQHLLDRRRTDAQTVVENLFQLTTLRALARKVHDYWDSHAKNATATEERGLSRRKNRLVALRSRLATLNEDRNRLLQRVEEKRERLKEWRDRYNEQIKLEKDRAEKLQAAKEAVAEKERYVTMEARELLDKMRDPSALSPVFAQLIYELKGGLDRVKLPESAAREFFEELAEESTCICGRAIDEKIRNSIRSRASQYLGSDDVALLNSLKTAVEEAVGLSRATPERALSSAIEQLEETETFLKTAKNQLDELSLEAEQADPRIKEASDEIRKLEEELSQNELELQKYESQDDALGDDHTTGIGIIERRIQDAERKLAEVTNTLMLRDKRDVLNRILQLSITNAARIISDELCTEANARVAELMPENRISIERIEKSLVLSGQTGGSVGETLSIGYAFLSTLFDRAEHQLPFVVDSPAGPIDLNVRPRIGSLVPRLTDQFVAFTISSERERFVDGLRAATKDIQYLTLFRKLRNAEKGEDLASEDVKEFYDGVLVSGVEFFNRFQLESEEL